MCIHNSCELFIAPYTGGASAPLLPSVNFAKHCSAAVQYQALSLSQARGVSTCQVSLCALDPQFGTKNPLLAASAECCVISCNICQTCEPRVGHWCLQKGPGNCNRNELRSLEGAAHTQGAVRTYFACAGRPVVVSHALILRTPHNH
jgi:hypothetical protein